MAYKGKSKQNLARINEAIDSEQVRLVKQDGEMVGVIPLTEAIALARKEGLDVVEMARDATPPVCKLMDYGKYRFSQQRKRKDNKSKQKVVHLKEIKVRPTIDKHDYEVKMRNVRKFITAGDKVKISLRFRGREITHADLGEELLKRIREEMSDIAKPELDIKMEGRQMMMILMPL